MTDVDSCRAASKVCAAAALELFPNIQLKQEWIQPPFFAYEVVFPFAFQENFLILLQEKIRFLLKSKREIRSFEMMPSNAAQLLKHKGQPIRAELALDTENSLVSVVQIEEFVDLLESELLATSTEEVPICELIGFIAGEGEKICRLIGTASPEHKDIKKKFKRYPKNSFIEKGGNLHLFSIQEDNLYWLQEGILLREAFVRAWREVLQEAGFAFIETTELQQDPFDVHSLFKEKENLSFLAQMLLKENTEQEDFLELFEAPSYLKVDCNHIFYSKDKVQDISRSCLQLLYKIPKMISLECQGVLKVPEKGRAKEAESLGTALEELGATYSIQKVYGSQLSFELKAPDGLGRLWDIASLSFVHPKMAQDTGCVRISLLHSLDRLIFVGLDQLQDGEVSLLKFINRKRADH